MIDKKTILQWFTDVCDSLPEEKTGDEVEWVLTGKIGKLGLSLVYPKNEDFIQIQRRITISAEHRNVVQGKSRESQTEFYYNLKRGLLFTGARWELRFSDPGETDLEEVRMSTKIFEDGITRDTFQQRLMMVHDASVLLLIELQHLLNE